MQVLRNQPDQPASATSATKFLFWRENNRSFSGLAAHGSIIAGLNLTNVSEPDRVRSLRVSSDFFKVLQINPEIGRDFSREEERLNSERIVILSNDLWQRRFGGDRNIVGRAIMLSGESYTVVGVTPKTFTFSPAADLWTPLRAEMLPDDQANLYNVIGRLKPGVTMEQAQNDLNSVAEQFRNVYPALINNNENIIARSYHRSLVGDVQTSLLILFAVVGLMLLIACFNVTNLLLARSNPRRKEMAVRVAMGASNGRIIRQLFTESALLAVIGGSVGVVISFWGLPVLLSFSPGNLPRLAEIHIDTSALLFTLGVALFSTLLFGIAPALVLTKTDLNQLLKESGRAMVGRGRRLFQNGLVVTQLALSLVMIIGAALLIESFARLNNVEPGFDANNVLTMQVSLNGSQYDTAARMKNLTDQVAIRLEAIPGVESFAAVTNLPIEQGLGLPFEIVADPNGAGDPAGDTQWRAITPRYFETMRIPLQRGRAFEKLDTLNTSPVAIINEALARQYWRDRDPIGESILIGKEMGPRFKDAPRRIVGIVSNVRELGLENNAPPTIFVPAEQLPDAYTQLANNLLPLSFVIRTHADPTELVNVIRRETLAVNREQPVTNFRLLKDVLSKSLARQHFNMLLISIFAAIAFILSVVGLYSLVSYSVAERAHEMAIRAALGGQPRSLLLLVISNATKLILVSLALGLAAALALTRLLSTLLFDVKTTDPLVFFIGSLSLVLVAILASYIPARRASRVDPMIALRQQ
jgi:predicted permease